MILSFLKNRLNKKEIYFLLLISFLLIIISSLPYIYLQYKTPDNFVYGGTTYINPADNYIYYSYINQAKHGAWLIDDLYTGEETILTIRPFWVLLGKIAMIFNWSPVFIFHFFRVILILFFVFVAYFCLQIFTDKKSERFLSGLIFFFTSGFGWILILSKPFFWLKDAWRYAPFDFIRAFSFPFLSILSSPHFIFSWIFIILIISLSFQFLQNNKITIPIVAGILANLLFLIHPFSIPLILVLISGWWLYQTLLIKKIFTYLTLNLVLFFIFLSPTIIYYIYLFLFDWTTTVKTLQNYLISPNVGLVMISFGPIILFALFGFFTKYKKQKHNQKNIFLFYWAIVNSLMVYFPVFWQRRLVQGWFFPLSILAGFFIVFFDNKMSKQYSSWSLKKYFIYTPLILFFILSNINAVYLNFYFKKQNYNYLYYYPQDIKQVAEFFAKDKDRQVIFTNTNRDSIFLPSLVERKIFFGHLVETLFAEAKANSKQWFFNNNENDNKKQKFLKNNNINFIVFDKSKKDFYKPKEKKYLQPVFENNNYYIYRVK